MGWLSLIYIICINLYTAHVFFIFKFSDDIKIYFIKNYKVDWVYNINFLKF